MATYRCKNCGQLVEPEQNKICPSCKIELAGNMIKESKKETKAAKKSEKKKRKIKRLFIRFAAGLIFLYVFFGILLPKWIKQKDSPIYEMSNKISDVMVTSIQNQAMTSGTEKGTDDFKRIRKKYYVNKNDVKLQNNLYISSTNKTDILEFSVKTYWNGDVWINGPIGFVPFGTITIKGTEYPLLYPCSASVMMQYMLPNCYDDVTEYCRTKEDYLEAKNKLSSIFHETIYNEKPILAVALLKNAEDEVILQNVTLHYEFAENKKIQIMKNGTSTCVYEMADGSRCESYLDIPHELIIDEVSEDTTILLDSIEIEVN